MIRVILFYTFIYTLKEKVWCLKIIYGFLLKFLNLSCFLALNKKRKIGRDVWVTLKKCLFDKNKCIIDLKLCIKHAIVFFKVFKIKSITKLFKPCT